jgi:hypothetical protein
VGGAAAGGGGGGEEEPRKGGACVSCCAVLSGATPSQDRAADSDDGPVEQLHAGEGDVLGHPRVGWPRVAYRAPEGSFLGPAPVMASPREGTHRTENSFSIVVASAGSTTAKNGRLNKTRRPSPSHSSAPLCFVDDALCLLSSQDRVALWF